MTLYDFMFDIQGKTDLQYEERPGSKLKIRDQEVEASL